MDVELRFVREDENAPYSSTDLGNGAFGPGYVQRSSSEGDDGGISTVEALVGRETHTLGCLLETHLRRDRDVIFAAYAQDHPLEDRIRIRVTGRDPIACLSRAADAALSEVEAGADACRKGLREAM